MVLRHGHTHGGAPEPRRLAHAAPPCKHLELGAPNEQSKAQSVGPSTTVRLDALQHPRELSREPHEAKQMRPHV